jgi:hypoxanthine phosphoribosyltransferase
MTLGETLIEASAITTRVEDLGDEISEAYADLSRPLVLICILKGSVFFASDLGRAIRVPVEFEFIACRSYGASTTTSGNVELTKDVGTSLEGRDVLVVEDIVDTGLTTTFVMEHLRSQGPASVRLATLLDKKERRIRDITPDFCGFEIPDKFVVGYGLDLGEAYRNLRDIRVMRESASAG